MCILWPVETVLSKKKAIRLSKGNTIQLGFLCLKGGGGGGRGGGITIFCGIDKFCKQMCVTQICSFQSHPNDGI